MTAVKTLGLVFDAEVLSASAPTAYQAATAGFLRAYLDHGAAGELVGLARETAGLEAFKNLVVGHPRTKAGRAWKAVGRAAFERAFDAIAQPVVLADPELPDPGFAWARQRPGAAGYVLTGIAVGLAGRDAIDRLNALVTAPFEESDAVICPSEADRRTVLAVTTTYAEYLRDRFGGSAALRPRLAVIPWGVNPDTEKPSSAGDRAAARHHFGVAADEVVVLAATPLAFHTDANPYPLFVGLSQAAREANRKVHLLLAGRSPSPNLQSAVTDAARVLCPTVRVSVVDPHAKQHAPHVWHAPEISTSLGDGVRESLDLSVLKAMARGLPVVAADWGANRELIRDGETGLLVPTRLGAEATADAAARFVTGSLNPDEFRALTSQSVVVDPAAAGSALTRVIRDDELRAKFGAAGRQRVLDQFTWAKTVATYDALWAELAQARAAAHPAGAIVPQPTEVRALPACYPPPGITFAGHASSTLHPADKLSAAADAETRLHRLVKMVMTAYAPRGRCTDVLVLKSVLDAAARGASVADLDTVLREAGLSRQSARATLAWMLKYGLVTLVS
ncbi:MAG TPA: glycosyltransferase family 4 protein [Gemmataceae bacterium]|nr:glycosyltransferase family 4 protein [Gemmataceae bacterium]